MQVGITWRIGKMGVPMTASQLNWGLRHVWVWCQEGVGHKRVYGHYMKGQAGDRLI